MLSSFVEQVLKRFSERQTAAPAPCASAYRFSLHVALAPWDRLLKRLSDDEHGPNCDGRPMIMAAIDRIAVIVGIFTYPGVSAHLPVGSRILKAASSPVDLIFNPEWFLLRLVYPLGPLRVYQRQRREEHVY